MELQGSQGPWLGRAAVTWSPKIVYTCSLWGLGSVLGSGPFWHLSSPTPTSIYVRSF